MCYNEGVSFSGVQLVKRPNHTNKSRDLARSLLFVCFTLHLSEKLKEARDHSEGGL